MKLCVFQGTFNPIHNVHIKIAEHILKHCGFDKILFIPAHKPPHKECNEEMNCHRYEMVKLVVSKNPKFDISDIEYKRDKKSYTFDTITELYNTYPIEDKIRFVIGTDAFKQIESWYKTDELKKMVDFIVFIRENNFDKNEFRHLKDKGYCFSFAKMEFVDISSTDLRKKIANNEPVSGLIGQEVERYIKENELYRC